MEVTKEMKVIKECVRRADFWTIVLRTNTYASSMSYFERLHYEIYKDFGVDVSNDKDNINVVQYAGIRYAGTFGLEFKTNNVPPECYRRINDVEETY